MSRKCKWKGCATKLEASNKGPCCHAHTSSWVDSIDKKINALENLIDVLKKKKDSKSRVRMKKHKFTLARLKRIQES